MNVSAAMAVDKKRTIDTTTRRLSAKFDPPHREPVRDASMRMMVYSHDTMGIGHMRRNLRIASHIQSVFAETTVLAITGAVEACAFSSSAGVDCLALPAYSKNADGTYSSRRLSVSPKSVLNIRQQTILAAVRSFHPHIFLVDKVPAGAGGELLATLEWLRSNSSCQIVLGLREILDDAKTVRREWDCEGLFDIVRKYFDEVWIYGDPHVYDSMAQYDFPPDIRQLARYTGYLQSDPGHDSKPVSENDYILCTVGGGQDGATLVRTFMKAASAWTRPTVVLAGPHFPKSYRDKLARRADRTGHIRWIDFSVHGDRWIRDATRVVAMGGYNTLVEILSYRKKALIIPRTTPRVEQALRANRLAKLGWIDTLPPEKLTASAIHDWVHEPETNTPCDRPPIDMNGLDRITELLMDRLPGLQRKNMNGVGHA